MFGLQRVAPEEGSRNSQAKGLLSLIETLEHVQRSLQKSHLGARLLLKDVERSYFGECTFVNSPKSQYPAPRSSRLPSG